MLPTHLRTGRVTQSGLRKMKSATGRLVSLVGVDRHLARAARIGAAAEHAFGVRAQRDRAVAAHFVADDAAGVAVQVHADETFTLL